jgi:hypothetical protein
MGVSNSSEDVVSDIEEMDNEVQIAEIINVSMSGGLDPSK